jgi:hypothetical protein
MNTKNYAKYLGTFVLVLGLLGLLMGEGKLANIMNIDLGLDLVRIVLGVILLGTGFMSKQIAQAGLALFGLAYLGAFIMGMLSPTLFGIVPNGVGPADQMLHLLGGILALLLAVRLPAMISSRTA